MKWTKKPAFPFDARFTGRPNKPFMDEFRKGAQRGAKPKEAFAREAATLFHRCAPIGLQLNPPMEVIDMTE